MTTTVRAVFRKGAFIPHAPCLLPENSEVNLTIESPMFPPPAVTDPAERQRILDEVIESMRNNPIPPDAPRFTREEMHERR